MTVQPIRLFGDPALRTPAEPVVNFDKELRVLVRDLTETMIMAPGGARATWVGLSSTKPITLMACCLSIDSMKQRASWP